MSPADKIACRVKAQHRFTAVAPSVSILIGRQEMAILESNPDVCNPPDLSKEKTHFCGFPVVRSHRSSALAFFIPIP